ncbi:hypothetical protein MVEN_00737200 [Mycena venus]|uniref:Ribosomal protein L10e/L16 domain-containing protein n=1 Tax=Mycena venus TaxID=2733690 RepID=A0A8H6YJZ7_9AGAR|nr:hypothetical protein MVEN_00737200 [Mycena venus]
MNARGWWDVTTLLPWSFLASTFKNAEKTLDLDLRSGTQARVDEFLHLVSDEYEQLSWKLPGFVRTRCVVSSFLGSEIVYTLVLQIVLSIRCKDADAPVIIAALRRARYRFPGRQKIMVSKKWGFTNVAKGEYLKLKEKKVFQQIADDTHRDGAYVQFIRPKGYLPPPFSPASFTFLPFVFPTSLPSILILRPSRLLAAPCSLSALHLSLLLPSSPSLPVSFQTRPLY